MALRQSHRTCQADYQVHHEAQVENSESVHLAVVKGILLVADRELGSKEQDDCTRQLKR
jgi:hypothetical protein